MEFFAAVDDQLFLAINGLRSPFLDWLFLFVTRPGNFTAPAAAAAALVLILGDKRHAITLAAVAVSFGLSDLTSGLIKEAVGRVRPCHVVAGAQLLVGCRRSFSFPSAHGANIAAAAATLILRHRAYGLAFLPLALLVGYSRIYVGVHYLSDVVGGGVIGIAWAVMTLWAGRRLLAFRERTGIGKDWEERLKRVLGPVARIKGKMCLLRR